MGQACLSEAETLSFPSSESKVPAHPTAFDLQAKTWRNVIDTGYDNTDWFLGEAIQSIPTG